MISLLETAIACESYKCRLVDLFNQKSDVLYFLVYIYYNSVMHTIHCESIRAAQKSIVHMLQIFCFSIIVVCNCHSLFNSEENLRAALGKMGVGGRSLDDILDKVRSRHYQVFKLEIVSSIWWYLDFLRSVHLKLL